MSPLLKEKAFTQMKTEEGYRQFVYEDTTGHFTVGIGRNLVNRGISLDEAKVLWSNDVDYFEERLNINLPFFQELDEVRQFVFIDMCFNMGLKTLLSFEKMLSLLEQRKFEEAANEMLDSKWANQVKNRAVNLAQIMRTGEM